MHTTVTIVNSKEGVAFRVFLAFVEIGYGSVGILHGYERMDSQTGSRWSAI